MSSAVSISYSSRSCRMMFLLPSVICTLCTGFFCLAIIKGPPNDNYFIIEGPCLDYFTEKVSQTPECCHGIIITKDSKKAKGKYNSTFFNQFLLFSIDSIISLTDLSLPKISINPFPYLLHISAEIIIEVMISFLLLCRSSVSIYILYLIFPLS